jgi:hypothetical protein
MKEAPAPAQMYLLSNHVRNAARLPVAILTALGRAS